ncbi:MAG: MFS transporter [Bauldia litoralis]
MNPRLHFAFLNAGHFFDHLFMLVYATVAALALTKEWNLSYAELIPYATPGFVAFGVCAIPAGWLADKWSRHGMMAIFFIGIGASSIVTALAQSPLAIGAGLLAIGVFAAIYHPVGLALVVADRARTGMALAVNGVFGNLGVACAALIAGFLIDNAGWRAAFVWPGVVSIAVGLAYVTLIARGRRRAGAGSGAAKRAPARAAVALPRRELMRAFGVVLVSTAIGGLVFQSTTFALPKVFDERLGALAVSATLIGWYAFVVFALAALGQLVVGFLVDRYSLRSVFMTVAALQAVLLFAMIQLDGWAALLIATAFMLAVFGQIPINDVLVGRIAHSDWRSRVYAMRYIVTFSVMALSVPMIAWIYAVWGFGTLFMVLAVAVVVIFATVCLLPAAAARPVAA